MFFPTETWFFSFKILSNEINLTDIINFSNYLNDTALVTFNHLQTNDEIRSILSISVLLIHYFLNRIEHLQTTLDLLAVSKFSTHIVKPTKSIEFKNCLCILCKFPEIASTFNPDSDLLNFFQSLKNKTFVTKTFILSILEKVYEIQSIHKTIICHLFPQMNYEEITQFITIKN